MSVLPEKDLMDNWRSQYTTQQVWKCIKESYDVFPMLLSCPAEKIEYFRGQAAIINDLQKIFETVKK